MNNAREGFEAPRTGCRFPGSAAELLKAGATFRRRVDQIKQRLTLPDYGWYPYDSLGAFEVLVRLLEPRWGEVAEALASGAIADIGCGDGDLGLFWAQLGASVDAVDHMESNYNQLRCAAALRDALGVPLSIHDIDLDGKFELPRERYAFAFFLGTFII